MSELPRELRDLADILTEAVLSLRRIAALVEKKSPAPGASEPQPTAGLPPSPEPEAIVPPDPVVVVAPIPTPEDARPAPVLDDVHALAREIDDAEPFLDRISRQARSAQLKVWAGRAREIQDRFRTAALPPAHERWGDLRAVFGRLTRITREQSCGWVDALTESWKTDWKIYVAIQQAHLNGKIAEVTADAERAYLRDVLQGLFVPGRRLGPGEASEAIREALRYFPDEADPVLQQAIQQFGRPPEFGPKPEAILPPDETSELAREIDEAEPFLEGLPKGERTAQVRIWAGRARRLQDHVAPGAPDSKKAELRSVFGRLTRITRESECEWVEALAADWATDWDVYVEMSRGWLNGKYPDVTEEQEKRYMKDLLTALFLPQRRAGAAEAFDVIRDAMEVFPRYDEPLLRRALDTYGRPPGSLFPSLRTLKKTSPKAGRETTDHRVSAPPEVKDATRGKRVLMIGGQGAREEHRRAMIEAMELAELEWVTSERNQSSPWTRLEESTATGKWDFVIYLASFTSHRSADLIREFKKAGVPVVYLIRGYSVNQVVKAVEEQLLPRLREPAV